MISALNILKSFGMESKPYNGFTHLPHGHYEIVMFKLVQNKMYNPKSEKSFKRILMVELKDQVLFLPGYFAANFQFGGDKKVAELNSDGIKKFLYFGGKRSNR